MKNVCSDAKYGAASSSLPEIAGEAHSDAPELARQSRFRRGQAGKPELSTPWVSGCLFRGGKNVASGNCRVSGSSPRLTFPRSLSFLAPLGAIEDLSPLTRLPWGVWADDPALQSANASLERAYALSPAMRPVP